MSTLERIKKLFIENYEITDKCIHPEATIDSMGLDSLDKIDFLFALEKEFNIKIPDREFTLTSIQDLITVIDKLVNEQHHQKGQKGA